MTITDAMVETAWQAYTKCPGPWTKNTAMRAALEAAYPALIRENEALRKQCDEWRADYNRRLGCPEEIVREFSSRATAHFDIFKDKP